MSQKLHQRMWLFYGLCPGEPMLVLMRAERQSLIFGDDIIVRVIAVGGGQIWVEKVTAPLDIFFLPKEVYDRVKTEDDLKKKLSEPAIKRRPGQKFMIGDDIEVEVLLVRGNYVRFGITAPRTVSVHRLEVYREIQRQKEQEKAQRDISNTQSPDG